MKPSRFSRKKREYIKWSRNVTEVRTVHGTSRPQEERPSLKIETDEKAAEGVYANLAAIAHTGTEFVLDFMFLRQDLPRARVGARVVTSPVQAKRLCAVLGEELKKYEKRFGPIGP